MTMSLKFLEYSDTSTKTGHLPYLFSSPTFTHGICLPSLRFGYANNPVISLSLLIMVAVGGLDGLGYAVGALSAQCRTLGEFLFGRPTTLQRSQSSVSDILRRPVPKGQINLGAQASKRRKHGRAEPKGYNDLAKGNSTLLIPGSFPGSFNGSLAGSSAQGQRSNLKPIAEEDSLTTNVGSLLSEKSELEDLSEAKARRIRKLEQRRERERLKDQKLAQLEKEKKDVQSELARERVQRRLSRQERVLKEEQRRQEINDRWKKRVATDARFAAQREENLQWENFALRNDLRMKDTGFLRACNEREYLRQGWEEEKARRLQAEASLHRWKEQMEEYFPRDKRSQPQQPEQPQYEESQAHQSQSHQSPPQQPQSQESQSQESQSQHQTPQPNQFPSPQAQFELYEVKWEVLRSGIDINGTGVHLINFSQIPWPILDLDPENLDPSKFRAENFVKFFLHPLRLKPDSPGKEKSKKSIAKSELRRWHSDQFTRIVLSKVQKEYRLVAAEAAGIIARTLTDMKDSD